MIQYETPPFRPPSEARSLLVRATRNCSWNRCIFCYGIHWDRNKLELRQVEEIKQDIVAMKAVADDVAEWAIKAGYEDRIEQVAMYNGILWLFNEGVKTAFIGDSDSLIMKTDDLVAVLECLYQNFPALERVTSYARAKTALRKTPQELGELARAGLSRLHLGLETGDDELLTFIDKGATADEMIEAGKKVKEAGISVSEYVILGMGGKDRWQQHVEGTARVLNAIDPDFIRVRTLMVLPGTPLQERVEQGQFKLASPDEILREERLLLELLEVKSEFVSDHVSNYLALDGKLPEAKSKMIAQLDRVLAAPAESRASLMQSEALRHP